MRISLEGRIILITGSTQGVGEGIALAAAEAGAKGLCITGRHLERGSQVVERLHRMGVEAIFVPADLEKEEECRNLIETTEKHFGYVDGLVNAAGLSERGTIEETSIALWDKLFRINARAPFILMQEFAKRLEKRNIRGSIVNIITISSHGGQPYITAYCASKGALAILTKNAAYGLRRHKIRVNGINIGWTNSPGEHEVQLRQGEPENWLEIADAKQPFGRLLRPKDIGPLAIYLLSDSSEMMTGSLIDFDQHVIGCYD